MTTADALRQVAAASEALLAAASGLDQYASLDQACGERRSALAALDSQISDAQHTLFVLTAQANAVVAKISEAEELAKAAKADGLARAQAEIDDRRTHLRSLYDDEAAVLKAATDKARGDCDELSAAVAELSRQRDALAAEIDAAKNRVAAL